MALEAPGAPETLDRIRWELDRGLAGAQAGRERWPRVPRGRKAGVSCLSRRCIPMALQMYGAASPVSTVANAPRSPSLCVSVVALRDVSAWAVALGGCVELPVDSRAALGPAAAAAASSTGNVRRKCRCCSHLDINYHLNGRNSSRLGCKIPCTLGKKPLTL